jgi:RNA processing factor Prp31
MTDVFLSSPSQAREQHSLLRLLSQKTNKIKAKPNQSEAKKKQQQQQQRKHNTRHKTNKNRLHMRTAVK